MGKKIDELQISRRHDERIFRDGEAIFSEVDLRELINYIYSEYQYKGTQSDKLVKLIDYLALESNRFVNPELAAQSKKLSDYLDNFRDFLKSNFQQGKQAEDGDAIYLFQTPETSPETEAFLAEFQLVAMDVEKGYKNYRASVTNIIQI
jgi:hypothetical protein